MNYDVLWKLFIKTGEVKYYNLLQALRKRD